MTWKAIYKSKGSSTEFVVSFSLQTSSTLAAAGVVAMVMASVRSLSVFLLLLLNVVSTSQNPNSDGRLALKRGDEAQPIQRTPESKTKTNEVAAAAAFGQPATCISEVYAVLGGWTLIQNPRNDDDVKRIVASATAMYTQMSNRLIKFEPYENGGYEAYKQRTSRFNFCVQFSLVNLKCTDNRCGVEEKVMCSVRAYKVIDEKEMHIENDGIQCSPVA